MRTLEEITNELEKTKQNFINADLEDHSSMVIAMVIHGLSMKISALEWVLKTDEKEGAR